MKQVVLNGTKTAVLGLVFVLIFSLAGLAQKKTPTPNPTPNVNLPKVKQIDETGLKTALKPGGKPLVVNFWATWCDPCREEFPDLVKLDADYKGKIDFITISLDDLAEINRDVPKFLSGMKAEMPAYLLKVADESVVISSIAKDWNGGLPFTILYNENGEIAYFRQGKVKTDVIKAEIDKLLTQPINPPATSLKKTANPLSFEESKEDYEKGKADAQTDISNGFLIIKTRGRSFDRRIYNNLLKEKYGVLIRNGGCLSFAWEVSYDKGYNEISKAEIRKRFGEDFFERVSAETEALTPMVFANVDELTLTINRNP